jgi:small subunit ribosomal protein S6
MNVSYEAMFLIDSGLVDEQIKAVVEKFTGIITKNGGEVVDVDVWEPRKLAYEVKGRETGRFILINFISSADVKNELDRIFGIADEILRSIIIRQDPRADVRPSRARAAEAERREREAAARAANVAEAVVVVPVVVEAPVVAEAPVVVETPVESEPAEASSEEA